MPARVPTTSENVMRCRCCKTYPTFKHTLCGGFYCATGKSETTPEKKGCECPHCPIYLQYGLKHDYFCMRGAAD